MQGQRSHLAQAKNCHARWWADLKAIEVPSRGFKTAKIGQYLGTYTVANTYSLYSPAWPLVDEPLNLELDALEPPTIEERASAEPNGWHQETDSDAVHQTKKDLLNKARWLEHFPRPAGQHIRREATMFESLRNAQVARGDSIWGSFKDKGDWDLACWIVQSGTTQTSADQLLELEKVSRKLSNIRLTKTS
jgi:hypothetical protein